MGVVGVITAVDSYDVSLYTVQFYPICFEHLQPDLLTEVTYYTNEPKIISFTKNGKFFYSKEEYPLNLKTITSLPYFVYRIWIL